ncbi:hypothetical protein Tco_1252532 [Tanacetum coccineum]
MKVIESLNVTFDESPPPTKLSPLVDDDVGEEAIKKNTKVVNNNNKEDELIEVDEIVNIKESKNHPLYQVIGNLNQRTLRSQAENYSNYFCFISTIEPKNVNEALKDESWVVAIGLPSKIALGSNESTDEAQITLNHIIDIPGSLFQILLINFLKVSIQMKFLIVSGNPLVYWGFLCIVSHPTLATKTFQSPSRPLVPRLFSCACIAASPSEVSVILPLDVPLCYFGEYSAISWIAFLASAAVLLGMAPLESRIYRVGTSNPL